MTTVIRTAIREDLPQLKELVLEAWLNAYRGIVSQEEIRAENAKFYTHEYHDPLVGRTEDGNHLFEVLEQESIVGLMDFDFTESSTWLMRFCVSPSLIGKGFGKQLMEHCEQKLSVLGRLHYSLMVHERNTLGIHFYQKNGFLRNGAWDRPADQEICYEKTL